MSYPSCHIHHPSLINPSQKPTPSTPSRLLLLAKKLCGKVALVDLADALNIPVEHAREFALEHERRRKVGKLKVCGGYLGPCWVRSYNVSSVIEGEDLNPQFGVKHGSQNVQCPSKLAKKHYHFRTFSRVWRCLQVGNLMLPCHVRSQQVPLHRFGFLLSFWRQVSQNQGT